MKRISAIMILATILMAAVAAMAGTALLIRGFTAGRSLPSRNTLHITSRHQTGGRIEKAMLRLFGFG